MSKKRTGGALWPRETFEYNGARVTVERQTVHHQMLVSRIEYALRADGEPDDPTERATQRFFQNVFARMAAQTVEMEGVAVEFPDSGAPPEKWRTAYALFQHMDGALFDKWFGALEAVDKPPNDPALVPSHRLDEAAQKNAMSAGLLGSEKSGAN